MTEQAFVPPDEIRARFSHAMSNLYRSEVPLYGDLLALVSDINQAALAHQPELARSLERTGERERLDRERHGAIRVGTADELATLRRLFAVMGMRPVGYYDLSIAGVPVHSTAFRATHEASLQRSPFRVFTSLLRLELIEEPLRSRAATLLARRRIFTAEALRLIDTHERTGGLNEDEARRFVAAALETFRWHRQATVDAETYRLLHDQHRLLADVVAFKGPHINHLTPRTLDIDAVQRAMPTRGIVPKAIIEGPPPRRCPILLRQTSFKALREDVIFLERSGVERPGHHTARFGEVEQRGAALTPAGRTLYDRLLAQARSMSKTGDGSGDYLAALAHVFAELPDDYDTLRRQGLAYFRYVPTERGLAHGHPGTGPVDLEDLIEAGHVAYEPLIYEDFLPVSAAGIFQSNLGENPGECHAQAGSKALFEEALGAPVQNEMMLYAQSQRRSLDHCAAALGLPPETLLPGGETPMT